MRNTFAQTSILTLGIVAFGAIAIVLLALTPTAEATHYRYGTLSWDMTGNGNEVVFNGSQAWRISYGSWSATPAVGAVVCDNGSTGTTGHLKFGDGTSARLCVKVTSMNTAQDWYFGYIVGTDGNALKRTYAGQGPYLAFWERYARISQTPGGNYHVNNPDESFRLETLVDLTAGGNSAPRTVLPPISDCPRDRVCTIQIPASDPQNDDLTFRLANRSEVTWATPQTNPPCCSNFTQPGAPDAPHALAIDGATGVLTWNTTGAHKSPQFPNDQTLYSFAVVIGDARSKVTVDAFLRIIDVPPEPPAWSTPPTPCGATFSARVGDTIGIVTTAQGGEPARRVTLGHLGLPPGATYPIPPAAYQPWSNFTWATSASSKGITQVVFRATDDLGKSAPPCIVSIRVEEHAPPVASFDCPPQPTRANELVGFTDRSSDSDGSIVSWAWDFTNDGIVDSTTRHATTTYSAPGTYNVRLKVTDNEGLTAYVVRSCLIDNAPPVAAFSWTPTTPTDLEDVAFQDASSDPDDAVVARVWDFAGLGASNATNPTFRFPDDGLYAVCLEVTDTYGATDARCHTVTVLNVAPVAAFTWSPETPTDLETVAFTHAASDADGTLAAFAWTIEGVGARSVANPSVQFPDDGVYEVCLEVTDDDGAKHATCHDVTVLNVPPIADFAWTPTTPTDLESAHFTSEAVDEDGFIASFHWDFAGLATSTEQDASFQFPDDGVYEVCLDVTDDDGETVVACQAITVLNVAPTAAFTWEPTTPTDVEPARFANAATDDDGAVASFAWDFGGLASSEEASPSFQFPDDGVYAVCLEVTDDDGATDALCQDVTVLNVAPVAAFQWSPTTPTDLETVAFTHAASDVDGDVVAFAWDLGGLASSTSPSPSFQFPDDGVYAVCLVVTDDDGATDRVCEDVTVLNVGPSVDFAWTPSAPTDLDVVRFTPAATDADGSIVAHSWTFASLGQSAAASPTFQFPDDGTYRVCVRVTDDDGASATACHDVVITNVPPVPRFTWTPTKPTDLQNASFQGATSSDPDGSVVAYAWDFAGLGTSASPAPSFRFPDNGNYSVCLRVTDDDAASATLCQVVEVLNVAPVSNFAWPQEGGTRWSNGTGVTVAFTELAIDLDGSVVNWTWTFGDGNGSFARDPTHVFPTHRATYNVCLKVRDNDLATHIRCKLLSIAPPVVRAQAFGLRVETLRDGPTAGATQQTAFFADTGLLAGDSPLRAHETSLSLAEPSASAQVMNGTAEIRRWNATAEERILAGHIQVPGGPLVTFRDLRVWSATDCESGVRGGARLAFLAVDGEVLIERSDSMPANSRLDAAGVAITLNQQSPTRYQGIGLQVTGIRIDLGGGVEVVVGGALSNVEGCERAGASDGVFADPSTGPDGDALHAGGPCTTHVRDEDGDGAPDTLVPSGCRLGPLDTTGQVPTFSASPAPRGDTATDPRNGRTPQ